MKQLSLTMLVVSLCVAGCGSVAGGGGGNGGARAAASEQAPARPVTTTFPEGIYFGEITWHSEWRVNGEQFSDDTVTEPYHEIVDTNGLPLIQPAGVAPVVGLVLTREIADVQNTFEVLSVSTSGNRLVIGYQRTFELEEMIIEGIGIWTYQYVPPDTLEFHDAFWARSNVSESGDIAHYEETATATVTLGDHDAEPDSDQPVPPGTDLCPDDPEKDAPGACGCGTADTDGDEDGTPDCKDGCPDDPGKTNQGTCGCGVADTDSDGDGTSDCIDRCEGQPDVDSDGDGVLDCDDACPSDMHKTDPGVCGCGFSDDNSCGKLLAQPLDGVIVLDADLSVWTVSSRDEFTASAWAAGDRVVVTSTGTRSSTLTNTRTSETISASYEGIGTRAAIVGFQDQQYGPRLLSLDDGTTWRIFSTDENKSENWRVGDQVVLFKTFSTDSVLNLRTGRVIYVR